jgi:YaiO family outer membrane protein
VLQLEPDHRDARRFRAEWLARRGQVTNALAHIEALLAAQPADRQSTLLQAQWLNQLGRPSNALAAYDRWLEREPGDTDIRIRRALVLRQKGELSQALGELNHAVATEPDNTFARHSLIQTLLAAGRAHEAWRRADELDKATQKQDAELGLIKAGMLARLDAFALAEELASRTPANPDQARRQVTFRAMLWIRQDQQERGLELLAPYADLRSDDYDALLEVANAYAAADRLNVARAYFQRAATVTPQRPEAHLALARLASSEGRLTDSLARYQALLDENPEALEASLGILRVARTLGHFHQVRPALDQARQHAPHSPELYREELLLALETGNLPAFGNVLGRYEAVHPDDPVARLWRLRWHAMEARRLNFEDTEKLLDPFAPDVSGDALWLLATTPLFDQVKTLADWQADETLPARPELFRVLARQLALRLRPRNAELLVDRARGLAGTTGEPSAEDQLPVQLAAGWWAHVATPFAWAGKLTTDFDPQAIHIWLAGETERRLRTMSAETESPVYEEWVLRRAVWFQAWRDNWHSPEAANSLYEYLAAMIPGAFENLTPTHLENAWRESERWLPPGPADFNLRITQARWRQARHDLGGALALYRQLAHEHPEASEPRQRQSAVLRALGRTPEALLVLRELSTRPDLNPVTHLEAADMFTRLGEYEAAARQLHLAVEAGYDEPLLYLRQAELALARGLDSQAEERIAAGLATHPNAAILLARHAEQLLESRNSPALAELARRRAGAVWLTPDLLAAARPHLTREEIETLTNSPQWWFQWHWLPWQRLDAQSLNALRTAAQAAAAVGQREHALELLRPAASARIPDADVWLALGRLSDMAGEWAEAERAYRLAHTLGLGRPDAELARLTRRARQAEPEAVVRELVIRLAAHPDDFGLREALVIAAIRAGELSVAERALAPLMEIDPNRPAVRDLAALVKGAQGSVRQARSLYASILRGDPADIDRREALRALQSANQWGLATGYEFSDLRGTTGNPDPADWREAFAGVFWRQPTRQNWALEYRRFERASEHASQLRLDYNLGLDEDWILRGHAAPRVAGDITPRLKLGGGASYRVMDSLFATIDLEWLRFSDLDVYQFAPGLNWRWHPRSTLDTRVYLNHNVLDSGTGDWTATWVLNANWELTQNSSARLSFAVGDEGVGNPIRDLIGNDSIASVGVSLNWAIGDRWTLIPGWRYERHKNFYLHAFSLGAVFSY